ncbi:MAG: hypothetical protein QOI66_3417 [Myxococcales bacterium]|nr:hypothetical protein [Myxococcales bacterium]
MGPDLPRWNTGGKGATVLTRLVVAGLLVLASADALAQQGTTTPPPTTPPPAPGTAVPGVPGGDVVVPLAPVGPAGTPPLETAPPAPAVTAPAYAPSPAVPADVPAPLPPDRPFYKKRWFWGAVAVFALTAVVIVVATSSSGPNTPNTTLGDMRAF